MARDDRERHFENALARHLGPDAPAGAAAEPYPCPDSELLAAYHESLLAPEQMISSEQHVARCSRCQEILAQLARADEIPLDPSAPSYQADNIVKMKPSDPPALADGAASAAVLAEPQAGGAANWPQRVPQLRRAANWRWLAPACAVAAGLVLWVTYRENGAPQFEMAKKQPAPVAAPATPPPAPPPSPRRSESPEPQQAGNTRSPSSTGSDAGDLAAEKKPQEEANFEGALKQAIPAAPLAKRKFDRPGDPLADKSLPLSGRQVQDLQELSPDRLDANKDAKEFREQVEVAAGAGAPPVSEVAGASANPAAPAKPRQGQASGDAAKQAAASTADAVTVPTPQLLNGVPRSSTTAEVVRLTRSQNPTTVSAPDGKAVWRIEAAGIVEHSADAGSSWMLQKTGVVADLIAGSAPSDKICWIVGRSGTILRTTDGGGHWLKVRSPVADDLSAVFAVDALEATVSAPKGKGYKTLDGGGTWSPQASQ